MDILKHTEETLKDYKIGLFRNKDKYSLSNKDIAELINHASNSNRDESSYRKWYAAYQEGYEDAIQYTENNSAMLNYLSEKRIEVEKERKKAQTERIETNKWIREQAREEMFYDSLIDSIKENMSYCPHIEYIEKENSESDAVLFLSDQHYGVDFKIYGINNEIINEYSPETFEERMNIILNDTISQLKIHSINELHVICLGDTLDGMLRNSQLIKLRWGVVDCAVKYANYMFKWLTELSKYTRIKFYNTSGNHTEMRLLDGKKGEHERENIDKVIISIIKNGIELTDNKNIQVVENKSGYVYTTLPNSNYSIFGFHGEAKDLEKAALEFQEVYNTNIDYIAAGHLHHNNINLYGSRKGAIRVGSIIGCDDFSLKLRKRTDATTTFCIFQKDYGLTDTHFIVLN